MKFYVKIVCDKNYDDVETFYKIYDCIDKMEAIEVVEDAIEDVLCCEYSHYEENKDCAAEYFFITKEEYYMGVDPAFRVANEINYMKLDDVLVNGNIVLIREKYDLCEGPKIGIILGGHIIGKDYSRSIPYIKERTSEKDLILKVWDKLPTNDGFFPLGKEIFDVERYENAEPIWKKIKYLTKEDVNELLKGITGDCDIYIEGGKF